MNKSLSMNRGLIQCKNKDPSTRENCVEGAIF